MTPSDQTPSQIKAAIRIAIRAAVEHQCKFFLRAEWIEAIVDRASENVCEDLQIGTADTQAKGVDPCQP